MLNLQPATLRGALQQLDQAAQDHLEWHANLLRAIVCELPSNPNDLAPDAHRLCRFGRWYYESVPGELRHEATFAAIGVEHQRVHQVATGILQAIVEGRPVGRETFDELMACSQRLRRELDLLRRELQFALRSRDALTGAYGRDQVMPELTRLRASAKSEARPSCVVLMDLDRLRDVNEAHGHLLGDELLAEAVRVLGELLRPDEKVFRYGGDEFVVSLPGAGLDAARSRVTAIRDALARRELFIAGAGSSFRLTASFGVALIDPTIRVEDSLDHAVRSLQLAQAAGGNRAVVWDPSITTGRHARLEVEKKK
jgi:diguanylate cyclase (GGDEF)-like protein